MHANKEFIKKLHPCSVSKSPYASVLAPSRLRTFPCGVGLWPAGSSGVSPLEHSKIKNGNPTFTLRAPVQNPKNHFVPQSFCLSAPVAGAASQIIDRQPPLRFVKARKAFKAPPP